MVPKAKTPWGTIVLAISLLISLAALGVAMHALDSAQTSRMPEWIMIEEGPVAHGWEKFYRKAYFKGVVVVAGDVQGKSNLDVSGKSTFTGTMELAEAAGTITVTQWITPSASYYQLDPAAEITITLGACSDPGTPVILYNKVVSTVNMVTTNILPTASFTLGQHDLFVGLCDGSKWIKFHVQNN